MVKLKKLTITTLLLILLCGLPLYPQDFQPLEEEAPEAIFQAEIGDSEVDFFIDGSWNAQVSGAAGLLISPNGKLSKIDAFPEYPLGFLFQQQPDLTFSVWLMQRYFVEFSVLGSFDQNSFRMGYQGKEDEWLQKLIIGNRGIGIDPYPYMSIPETGDSSLGIEAELASGSSSHQLLLRFDNNDEGKKVFIGKNEMTEEYYPLESYIQGRFFKLPDHGVDSLVLYLEDADGSLSGNDGRNYRAAEFEEAVLDSQEGTVRLKQPHNGRVLVYYRKGGLDVGDGTLGRNALADIDSNGVVDPGTSAHFDWAVFIDYLSGPPTMAAERQITIDGNVSLLLWEPGVFSPFDILSSYPLPLGAPSDIRRIRVSLARKGSGNPYSTQPVSYRVLPEENRFEAYISDDLRGDLYNLYPFTQDSIAPDTDPDSLLYGPFRDITEGNFPWRILVQILYPVSGYMLESEIIPGSVRITRNGEEETHFTVNYDTGEITFLTPVQPNERIEARYQRRGAVADNGDLLFAWGNRMPFSPNADLTMAAGFRWNALPGAYSETAYSRTGALLASAGVKGSTEKLKYELNAGLSYSHPDTTGILRMMGMEEAGLTMDLSEDLAYPSGVPVNAAIGVNAADRGKLLYKDYREYGFLGSAVLQGPEWTPPPVQIFSYSTGSRPGPYNVAGSSSGAEGRSLVIDFEMDGINEWVGIQIPVHPGSGLLDLSYLKAVFLSYKAIDVSGNFDIFLQIGETDEDIDSDSILDSEISAASSGFLFNDTANSANLFVGGGPKLEGNLRIDTEDIDGNSFLDPEDDEQILTLTVDTGISTATTWKTFYEYFLIDNERLKRVRSVRLIIKRTSAIGTGSGRLLIDQLRFAGSSFGVLENATTGTIQVREISEAAAKSPPPEVLTAAFPIVQDTFHSLGEPQKVLEVEWSGCALAQPWVIQGFTQTGTEGAHYREISLFMRLPILTAPPTISFDLLDDKDKGIHWSFDPSAVFSDWRELRVLIDEEKLLLNGSTPSGASVTVDSDYGSLSRFQVSMTGSAGGTIYLDELHLKDPQGAFGAALAAETSLSLPGPLLVIGETAVLSDFTLTESVSVISPGFSALYGRPGTVWGTSAQTNIGFSLLFSEIDLNILLRGRDTDFSLSGGHSVNLPGQEKNWRFSDAYDLQTGSGSPDFSRSNSLHWNFAGTGQLNLSSAGFSREGILDQAWEGSLKLQPEHWPTFEMALSLDKAATGYVHQENGYLASWILGYRYLAPWNESTDMERDGGLDIKFLLPPAPFGFELEGQCSYDSDDISLLSRSQSNELIYSLNFPVLLKGTTGIGITPGYRRSWQASGRETEPGGILDDAATMAYRISTQPYIVNQIPIWELFSPIPEEIFKEQTRNFNQAVYYPHVNFNFSRRIQSHWSGLILPTNAEVSVGKSFEKEGDRYQYFTAYEMTYGINAINLFGKFGAYRLFNFYELDEISSRFNVSLRVNEKGVTEKQMYGWDTYLGLEGEGGNVFSLENRFSASVEDEWDILTDAALSLIWYSYPENGIRLPLIAPEISKEAYFSHDDSLSVKLRNSRESDSVHTLTVTAGHMTGLRFPGHGYLRAGLSLGFDVETALQEAEPLRWYRLALMASIEGKIQF